MIASNRHGPDKASTPARLSSKDGRRRRQKGSNLVYFEDTINFPQCQLHHVRIVNAFPRGCPLAEQEPFAELKAMKDKGFSECGSGNGLSVWLLRRVETCQACASTNLRHHIVRHLRGRLLQERESVSERAEPAAKTTKSCVIVPRRVRRRLERANA